MDENTRSIVQELTKIRLNNYRPATNSFLYQSAHFNNLIDTVLEILKKIIQSNSKSAQENQKQFERSKESIVILAPKNQDLFIFFSCQLLQYFTIICDTEFASKKGFSAKQHFIESKNAIYGATSNNLFLLDYFIVSIYNEVFHCEDDLEKMSTQEKFYKKKWLGHEEKKMGIFVGSTLSTLKKLKLQYPSLLIIDYLLVIYNYTYAHLTEYLFKLDTDKYLDTPPESLINKEITFINEAQKCLTTLEKTLELYPVDLFLLGKELSEKLPVKSIIEFKKHLVNFKSN